MRMPIKLASQNEWSTYSEPNGNELNLFLRSVNPQGYKNTGYKKCQQTIFLKNIQETMKDISIKYKYTRNKGRLQMSMNDKDSYKERQMHTSHTKCS